MKSTLLVLALFLPFVGCTQWKKLTNTDQPKKDESHFYIVACCRDNDGSGHMSYPAFLPPEQVNLCESARHAPDGHIGNDIYLATSVDCGNQMTKLGDEYYAGKGY
jgi:hypothetical protein